ncbi:uncharacterized protein [Nicotiana tomentosiformis]|uniref:uncharacterized protein n=1 Tax=Nicotiana tomentosiformis TaxID=4098 RepID=UPI00388C3AE3
MTLDSPQITAGSSYANNQHIDCNDPLYVHPSYTPDTSLVPQQLIGTENYSKWRRSMEMSLLVKNKLGFVDETCTREQYEKNVFQLKQWDRCNTIVQSWIQNSVVKELKKGIVYSSNAQKGNQLPTQGISSVSVYFSNLNDLWDEFESIILEPCDCEKSKAFVEFLRQQKLMKFLMGLNDTYAPQRSQILMIQPTFSLDQAYSMIVQEESQRLSSGYGVQNRIPGSGPMNTESSSFVSANNSNVKFRKNTNMFYNYCKMKGHTREACYKLVGYPQGFKFNKKRRRANDNYTPVAHNVSMMEETKQTGTDGIGMINGMINVAAPIFTPEQYQQILRMLSN